MGSKLTQLAKQRTAAQLQLMSRDSLKWLTKKISELKNPSGIASTINNERFRSLNRFHVGGLYFFYYDPKTKKEIPYYDRFPLVLVLERYDDGFLGLNLHYLPLKYRLSFLDKLMDYAVLDGNNDILRMRVSYDILNASKRFREFKPCLKKYLYSHVQSKILAVQPNEWDIAAYLPIHQFKKASVNEVWQDSLNEIRKN
jgi:hypothetical protein